MRATRKARELQASKMRQAPCTHRGRPAGVTPVLIAGIVGTTFERHCRICVNSNKGGEG